MLFSHLQMQKNRILLDRSYYAYLHMQASLIMTAIFSNSKKTPTDKIYISGHTVNAIPSTPRCFNFANTRTFDVYYKPLADVKQFGQ